MAITSVLNQSSLITVVIVSQKSHMLDFLCAVDKLLSLNTVSNADFTFTRQRMHDVAKLTNDDILYERFLF